MIMRIKDWLKDKISNKKIALFTIVGLLIILVVFLLIYAYNSKKKASGISKPEDDMILIPAGNFIMGSTEKDAMAGYEKCTVEEGNDCLVEDYFAEYPQRDVYIDNFYIDKKEVSNEDYNKFAEQTKRQKPFYWDDSNLNSLAQSVVGISWNDAKAYCEWVNKRLPTEVEWEKAARGTDGRIWPWGNNWDTKNSNHGTGGLPGYDSSDGYEYTSPVGIYLADISPYGVLNMAGNVQEWVSGDFKAYSGNDKFLHKNFGRPFKVIRGGAYTYSEADDHTSSRSYDNPVINSNEDVGFRCAR
ncbi:hypothetical protein COU23_01860 [Candidatus Kuenenbacteria bacterium CG10_big_fil_rev_8_21_14_0_10_36_11]|uniref:Sulfatase-modifying factor enzyme-like domain-containing protein n=1 Tax=Candidatus Kuenenbacteria bacterium CG10_big_fil_rev_8_21_14_0_10_36_11 TaxID=1974618 RepID=A0A2M6WAJ4_9BACT|nr:MAG: hypothetical protein COU23_01860 [Candidatus Kuenenbacteria bacterium CG10_big_fil_rev_8_21_14_0_10_36_11]